MVFRKLINYDIVKPKFVRIQKLHNELFMDSPFNEAKLGRRA